MPITASAESRRQLLDALTVEFVEVRFTERIADDGVTVMVDGGGGLIKIVIDDAMLAGPHPHRIGPAVITALTRARAAAVEHRQARINETLGISDEGRRS